VAAFLINHQTQCRDETIRQKVAAWTKAMMRAHLSPGHDFEVAWSLLVTGALRISLDKEDLPQAESMPSSTVFALFGMLHERGLLPVSLSFWKWRTELKRTGILGHNWLPFYESVRRGWTSDRQMISAVKAFPILDKMLSAKITFLEDRIFDVATINIQRRVFEKRRKEENGAAKPPRTPWQAIHEIFEY
jgi:hypothetical protein